MIESNVPCKKHPNELFFACKQCSQKIVRGRIRKEQRLKATGTIGRKGGQTPDKSGEGGLPSLPPATAPPKPCACCGSPAHKSMHHNTIAEKYTDKSGRIQERVHCNRCKRDIGSHMAGKSIPPQQALIDFFG